MADPAADTAAAMLKALRAAELSGQPLAVGLADALEELMDREYEESLTQPFRPCFVTCNRIEVIINQLRNTNHA